MKVLVACEFSGVVREAFAALGHDAWSCDIEPTERPGNHIQGDVRAILRDGWDLMIAHPPCTYLSRSGARWWKEPGRAEQTLEALAFVMDLSNAPIPHIAIENPIGQLNKLWRYPDQTIQPYWFGHPYSKATCLWLKELPKLRPTRMCWQWEHFIASNTGYGRREKRQKWGLGIARKPEDRARTFEGIAAAMAEQWSNENCYRCVIGEQLPLFDLAAA